MAEDKNVAPSLKTTEARGAKAIEKKANALQRLNIEYVDVDSIKPNSYNPNRQSEHDFKLLLRSIQEDGFTQPVVVQRSTREIVDGEHRWRAGRELGLKQVPVVFVDMTAEQMRISTLRHNRARGSEDHDLSTQLLRDLRELGALDWAKDSLMISEAEMQKLIDDIPAPEELAGEEFSEAWTPSRNEAGAEKLEDNKNRVAFTPAAKQMQEDFAKKLEKAETRQERLDIEWQNRAASFRVFLTFKDAEAAVVSGVLEPEPAVKLLALCRPIAARRKAEMQAAEEAKASEKEAAKAAKAAQ